VTSADLQRVAGIYLSDANRSVIDRRPDDLLDPNDPARSDKREPVKSKSATPASKDSKPSKNTAPVQPGSKDSKPAKNTAPVHTESKDAKNSKNTAPAKPDADPSDEH
jgi:hypothetical protein